VCWRLRRAAVLTPAERRRTNSLMPTHQVAPRSPAAAAAAAAYDVRPASPAHSNHRLCIKSRTALSVTITSLPVTE